MICPKCGNVNTDIPTPFSTRRGEGRELGNCNECDYSIWAMPTTKTWEHSQLETVEKGEEREELLVNIYAKWSGADANEKTNIIDIDRALYEDGRKVCYVEIKERPNSINSYKMTQFPYAKIESGKDLIDEEGLPVYIVLKFTDCWARHQIKKDKKYERGIKPFAPTYRPHQNSSQRQIPVKLDVERDLEVLSLRDLCVDSF